MKSLSSPTDDRLNTASFIFYNICPDWLLKDIAGHGIYYKAGKKSHSNAGLAYTFTHFDKENLLMRESRSFTFDSWGK